MYSQLKKNIYNFFKEKNFKKHFFSKKKIYLNKILLVFNIRTMRLDPVSESMGGSIKYNLSFPILGLRDLIRALQSTPFQNPVGEA